MMDLSSFALWKFKTVEGILRNVRSGDVTTTHYDDGRVKATIKYDLNTHEATIAFDDAFKLPVTCSFSKLADMLKSLNMYVLSPVKNDCATKEYTGNPDKD